MEPIRVTDGYVEVAGTVEQTVVELLVQESVQDSYASIRLTESVAVHLARWIIRWWIFERWCGLKSWLSARKLRKQLNIRSDV